MQKKRYTYLPNQENKTSENAKLIIFHYCNEEGVPVFKTKEIYKNEKKFVFYPYSIDRKDGIIKAKRIKKLELIGWGRIEDIPFDFKNTGTYGVRTLHARSFFSALYTKYRDVYHFTIGINIGNKFKPDHISLNWSDLQNILGEIYREKHFYDRERSFLINKALARINRTITTSKRYLPPGDLRRFLVRYDSFERVNVSDLNALAAVLDVIPPQTIKTTANFINSRDQINKVYIEEIISGFEKLLAVQKMNEKQWQLFFEKNAWILSHLFPYEVILRQKEAYVGGKTIENENGRVIDFLFQNGFKDNYALVEIKTHKQELLKKSAYRKPAAFAMSDDLSGGIAQCLDQKDTYMKEFARLYPSFDPKCIFIIGQKSDLTEHQKNCFELLRSSQKNVEIVTFDEILMKLKGLKNVLSLS
jgi:hypothetical protein